MRLTDLNIEFKWAFIFVVTTLLWLLMERLFGFHSTRIEQHDRNQFFHDTGYSHLCAGTS